MKLLLDTHILIWALNNDPRLSRKARTLIQDQNNTIYCSSVSIWEISIKHSSHPEHVKFSGEQLAFYCGQAGFIPLEMREKHVFSLETISQKEGSLKHHDPFDRMLIAQAKAEHMKLITHDSLLGQYSEDCIVLV